MMEFDVLTVVLIGIGLTTEGSILALESLKTASIVFKSVGLLGILGVFVLYIYRTFTEKGEDGKRGFQWFFLFYLVAMICTLVYGIVATAGA